MTKSKRAQDVAVYVPVDISHNCYTKMLYSSDSKRDGLPRKYCNPDVDKIEDLAKGIVRPL